MVPAGEAAPPPSAAAITAWNWIIEELADCKEFDTSIFGALLRWDRNVVADPIYGARAKERLALKYLEELLDSTQFPPSSPRTKPAAETPLPGTKVSDREINVDTSSESILYCNPQEVGGLNGIRNYIDESWRNGHRQFILQRRDALPKTSLEMLRGSNLEDYRRFASFSGKVNCVITGDQVNSLCIDNAGASIDNARAGDYEIASKKLKLSGSQIEQVKLLPDISTGINQNLLLKEVTSWRENQLSKQNVQVGLDDVACRTKQDAVPEFLVEKNKKPQSSSPVKGANNIQNPDVFSDGGQKILQESSSDGEGYYDAAPDFHTNDGILAAEKLRLLCSQNPVNNESQIGNWTQQRSCIKCDEGGQVLVCTASGCPIAVHESCLGPSVDIQNPEEFKCPFCSYQSAASAYYEARKKVSMARKTLSSFMGWGQVRKKVPPPTMVRASSHAEKTSSGNHPDKVCTNQRSETLNKPEKQNQTKDVISDNDNSLHAGEAHPLKDRTDDAATPSGEIEIDKYRVVSKAPHQEQAVAATISDGHAQHRIPLHEGQNQADSHHHFARMTMQCVPAECSNAVVDNKPSHTDAADSRIMETDKGSSSPEIGDSEPSDRPCSHEHAQGLKHQQQEDSDTGARSSPYEEITTYEIHEECRKVKRKDAAVDHDVHQPSKIHSGEHSSSNKGRKRQVSVRHSKRYENPVLPSGRRTRLPWTHEEEAILEEAMEKFCQSGEKSISWKRIWEYGSHIFHKTRLPADLRVKWRNMRMREG